MITCHALRLSFAAVTALTWLPAVQAAPAAARPAPVVAVAPAKPAVKTTPTANVGTTYPKQAAAATLTAQTNPMCSRSLLGDYYWEVGDVNGVQASGTVGTSISATTGLSIDSASKWIYASAAIQYYGGTLPAEQIPFLNFTSGYTNFGANRCLTTDTVASCIARNKPTLDPSANNFMSLGPANDTTLNSRVLQPVFNINHPATLGYSSPLIAGAVYVDASTYGAFLRRVLSGVLLMKQALGTHKVCTNPHTCSTAKSSPMQKIAESWSYSLGHWVEDDPLLGDHAFSSAGAGGFYPWIDKTKTFYGVLSRQTFAAGTNDGYVSAQCGRLIRQAFVTGAAVTTATQPTPSN